MSSFTRPLFYPCMLLSLLIYYSYQLSHHQLILPNIRPLVRITTIIISGMVEDDLLEVGVIIIIATITALISGLIFKVLMGL
jgi:hypothetical protein